MSRATTKDLDKLDHENFGSDRPLVLVSADSHIGPKLEDLREYCPAAYLERFDAFVERHRNAPSELEGFFTDDGSAEATAFFQKFLRNLPTAGHHDMSARLDDMDRDGVAAEVIFHFSLNGEPIPFMEQHTLTFDPTVADLEMVEVGQGIYNRWLADACAVAPDRLIGLAYLPMWSPEAAIEQVGQASEAGFRGVNFPAPRAGIKSYDSPEWEPFWSICEDLGMTLTTHSGAGSLADYSGPQGFCLVELESGGWPARRALHWMIFSGVFERHPGLRLVLTEQNGDWWSATIREYDSSYRTHRWQLKDLLPKPPSEYLRSNVFIGASFMAPFEARAAVVEGYSSNVIWGRDYPHPEGTFVYDRDQVGENMTRLSLRHAFSGLPADDVMKMVGLNGIEAYNLDKSALLAIADRIGAPSLSELATPIERIPEDGGVLAFRTVGAWG